MNKETFHVATSGLIAVLATGIIVSMLPEYYSGIATKTLIFIGLAMAWNIVGGIGGQLSLGHSVFIGLGALLPAAMLLKLSVPLWVGIVCAAIVSSLIGAGLSWLTFRFRLGHLYFALVTLAVGELGRIIVIGTEFLGGASGLLVQYKPSHVLGFELSVATQSLIFSLVFAALTITVTYCLLQSKLGYRLRALKGNEDAAQAIGIDLLRSKTAAMVISAILSSLGGSVFAQYNGFVDPEVVASPILIISIILFTAIGGIGTIWGPVLGVAILFPFGEILRGVLANNLPGLHLVIFGVTLVAVIRLMPNGLIGWVKSRTWLSKFNRRNKGSLAIS
ncbi:MAG: branched-chain amino acid ABC transporter permease [Rhizobiales bacterium]|nr:branched-chain amino acid ABC transporter permease [Hyphomicrobiales bacterium]